MLLLLEVGEWWDYYYDCFSLLVLPLIFIYKYSMIYIKKEYQENHKKNQKYQNKR